MISGWVITSSLLASIDPSHRRLDLAAFWSARVRRLLPAAAVVLLTIAVVWTALRIEVSSLQRDLLFALGWSANWGTITDGGDYWARFGEASPVAHFWSLAVEEQFYLVWPFVLWLIVRGGGRSRAIGAVALALAVSSIAAMVVIFDPSDPTGTYLHTGARAHSLLLGAAAACASVAARRRPGISRAVRLAALPAGLTALAILAVSDEQTTWLYRWGFPTFAASMAVVVMWVAELRAGGIFGHRGLRWIGDRSYGIYLWHWPVILLLAPPRVGVTGPARDIACIALAIALAAASYRWLEQPIRRSPRVTWRWAPGLVGAGMVACTLVVSLGARPASERPAEESVLTLPPLMTSSSLSTLPALGDVLLATASSPSDGAAPTPPAATTPRLPVRVLVVGDSTAVQLAETLVEVAASEPSQLLVGSAAFGGCGLSVADDGREHESFGPDGTVKLNDLSGCMKQWRELPDRVAHESIDVVLVSIGAWDGTDIHLHEGAVVSILDPTGRQLIGDAYRQFVAGARSSGARVVWVLPPDANLHWREVDTALDEPARWVALRKLIRSLQVSEIDLHQWLAVEGFQGPEGRPDGVHLAPEVGDRFVEEVVVPELTAAPPPTAPTHHVR